MGSLFARAHPSVTMPVHPSPIAAPRAAPPLIRSGLVEDLTTTRCPAHCNIRPILSGQQIHHRRRQHPEKRLNPGVGLNEIGPHPVTDQPARTPIANSLIDRIDIGFTEGLRLGSRMQQSKRRVPDRYHLLEGTVVYIGLRKLGGNRCSPTVEFLHRADELNRPPIDKQDGIDEVDRKVIAQPDPAMSHASTVGS